MKKLLSLIALLGLTACSQAANPSFSSFDQAYFRTNNLLISLRSNLPSITITNATNINLTVTSNLYITTNITVIDPLYTNYLGLWVVTNAELTPLSRKLPITLYTTLNFGGRTNTLSKSTNDLRYSNGDATNLYVLVENAEGKTAAFGYEGDSTNVVLNNSEGGFLFRSNNVTIGAISGDSGYTGSGTNVLSDNGTYQSFASLGLTNLLINPTDTFVPYRYSATEFRDSPIQVMGPFDITTANIDAQGLELRYHFLMYPYVKWLDPGINLVDTENFSQILLYSTDPNPTNTIVNLGSGRETVQYLEIYNWTNTIGNVGAFTLPANSLIFDGGGVVRLLGDRDWVGTNGMGIALRYIYPDWIEIGRFNLNTGSTGIADPIFINPTDNYVPYRVGSTNFGDSWFAVDGDDMDFNGTNAVHYINIQNSTNLLAVGIAGAGALVQGGDVLNLLNNDAKGLNVGTNYVRPSTDGALDLGGSAAFWKSFYLTNQIVFGPGVTNVMYRGGNDLYYTNSSTSGVYWRVKDGAGYEAIFGVDGSGNGVLDSTTGFTYVKDHMVHQGDILVDIDNTQSIGSSGSAGAFRDVWIKGKYYAEGFNNGLGAYSRGAIYHSGTNAAGTLIINSQSAGIAGDPKPIHLQVGGTNSLRLFAKNWKDSMVPGVTFKTGATAPTFDAFNGGPAKAYLFQSGQDDEVHFQVQLNHDYKLESDISPHVHWTSTAATGAGTNVVFELTSAWANVNSLFPAYSTNYVTNAVCGTNWVHQLSDFPHLSGSGQTVSSTLVCMLRRLGSTATADDYDQDVAVLGFDIHYEADSIGSDNELTKTP